MVQKRPPNGTIAEANSLNTGNSNNPNPNPNSNSNSDNKSNSAVVEMVAAVGVAKEEEQSGVLSLILPNEWLSI